MAERKPEWLVQKNNLEGNRDIHLRDKSGFGNCLDVYWEGQQGVKGDLWISA